MKPNSNIESYIQFKFVHYKSLLTCLDKMIYKKQDRLESHKKQTITDSVTSSGKFKAIIMARMPLSG